MRLLEVIPLARLPKGAPESLSYYTSRDTPAGSFVRMTMNKRSVVGVVIHATPLSDVKALIRKQDFALKKIDETLAEGIIPPTYAKLFVWTAKFFVSSKSSVIKAALPNYFAKPTKALKEFFAACIIPHAPHDAPARTEQAPVFVEGAWNERVLYYCDAIRTLFSESPVAQILVLFPTRIDANVFYEMIKNDFSESAVLATSAATLRKNAEIWRDAASGRVRIVIGTKNAVFIPIPFLSCIIIDSEHSPHYKSWDSYPSIDARDIAEKLSHVLSIPLITGGVIPREETWHRIHEGAVKKESVSREGTTAITVIDMKKSREELGEFRIISPALEEKMRATLSLKKQIFLFSGRRGFGGHILCRDCGHMTLCSNCAAPMVIHAEKNFPASRFLVCHKCLKRETPPRQCPECKGSSIQSWSIGSQKIEETISILFPDTRIIRIDSDASDDPNNLIELLTAVKNGSYDIVIGTEMAVRSSYMNTYGLSALISFTQLLESPDFRQEERVFGIIKTIQEMTQGELVIQTTTPSNALIRDIEARDTESFFKRDTVFRKSFAYPPFAELITVTVKNPVRLAAEKNALIVKALCAEEFTKAGVRRESLFLIGPVPAFIQKEKNEYIYRLILKIKDQHDIIKSILQNRLPSYATVDVNPKTIL